MSLGCENARNALEQVYWTHRREFIFTKQTAVIRLYFRVKRADFDNKLSVGL